MNTDEPRITARPMGLYESFAAAVVRPGWAVTLRRDGLHACSALTVSVREGLRVQIEMDDDDLDTLATMLRDAHSSQEREQ